MAPDDTPRRADSSEPNPARSDGIDDAETNLIIEFTVPADAFVLTDTLDTAADLVLEFERYVPTDGPPLPYLWVVDGTTAFEERASSDPTVARIHRVARFDGHGALYRIDWTAGDHGLLEWLRTREVTLLQTDGGDGEWRLKLRVESRAMLDDLRAYCTDRDIEFTLVAASTLTEPKTGQYNVTAKQRDALVTALEMGYFAIPRETTLEEVAAALGIATKSASERLRRGQTNLVSHTLTIGQPIGIGLG